MGLPLRLPRESRALFDALPHLSSEALIRLIGEAKPTWFASREDFAERVDHLITHAAGVLGQSGKTLSWLRCSFGSLSSFLAREQRWDAFLRGALDLQVRCIDDWVADMRARGLAHTTVHTYWRAVASGMNRIASQDGTVSAVRFATRPEPGLRRPRALPRSAVEAIFTFLRNQQWGATLERTRNLAIVGVMALAGLRRGEVLRLEVGDVLLETSSLRIRLGKGRGGGRDRTAYMTPQLGRLFSDYLEERRRAGRTHPEVFTSLGADRRVGEVTVRRLFSRIEAGTGIHVTPHMLRHSYATMLRQSGVSDRVAMELLGHRSLAMLQRYSAIFDGECATEAARLNLDVPLG
jgi:integrase